jgi:hypothetical protein
MRKNCLTSETPKNNMVDEGQRQQLATQYNKGGGTAISVLSRRVAEEDAFW